jgi:hypothetical protein
MYLFLLPSSNRTTSSLHYVAFHFSSKMKIQRLLLLLLVSIGACGAENAFLRAGRFLTSVTSGNSSTTATTPSKNAATTSAADDNSTINYAERNDDYADDDAMADDDDETESSPVGNFGATDDDTQAADDDLAASTGPSAKHPKVGANTTPFEAPEEVEPPYWKEFVTGLFFLAAIVIFILTARKTCCKRSGYQEVPSVTLVV